MTYILVNEKIIRNTDIENTIEKISLPLLIKPKSVKYLNIHMPTLLDKKNLSKAEYIALIGCYEFKTEYLWLFKTETNYYNSVQLKKTIKNFLGFYNGNATVNEMKEYKNLIAQYRSFEHLHRFLKKDAKTINNNSQNFNMDHETITGLQSVFDVNNKNIDKWFAEYFDKLKNNIIDRFGCYFNL